MAPSPPTSGRTRWALLALLAVAWAGVTVASALVHRQVWGRETSPEEATLTLQVASNILHVATAPAWLIMRAVTGRWGSTNLWYLLLADGLGWSFWVVGVAVMLGWRGVLLRYWRRRGVSLPSDPPPPSLARRRFLLDGALVVAGAGAGALTVRSAAVDPWRLVVRSYRVPIPGLPPSLERLRLVQLSDTHLGPRVPAAFIRESVALALSLKPDLVLLTGDYIHHGARFIDPVAALFTPIIRAGVPAVGVLGNHDWYGDGRAMSRALTGIGVRMIDNARLFLDARSRTLTDRAEPGACLCLGGVGDLLTDFISVRLALGSVPEEVPRLLLAHNPDTAEMRQVTGLPGMPAPRIDLMLCGHTHGGQIRFPLIGTPLIPSRHGQKYAGGLVRGPACPVLISRGVGMSLLPLRLGVPPEVVEIELTRA